MASAGENAVEKSTNASRFAGQSIKLPSSCFGEFSLPVIGRLINGKLSALRSMFGEE
ncbi:hypothetical protein [Rhodoplanes sp. Z2-YC6860]|uniref:hypothetical protein n=1 Tax=Rhodoplanes sp. Z2-YC6860 TaxID=674703 RepID=UPI0012ED488B|nr:hypothetical protein [Rhodoplanes sp. Z2-YC6860]